MLARRDQISSMNCVAFLLCMSATAYGANIACWTLDHIANEIIKQTDVNQDGILSLSEIATEFIMKWSPVGSRTKKKFLDYICLSFHDFTVNWIANYHDHHDTAHRFFNNLDINSDNNLCLDEIDILLKKQDTNPADGQVQSAEFKAFLNATHPDSHQNGGHGHGC